MSASPPSSNAGPSTPGAGPLAKSYEIPPRPKPGRKPATDEPASKRKAQNRESQRNFRARKAAKLEEVENDLRAVREHHQIELDNLASEARRTQARLDAEVARAHDLQVRLEQTMRMVEDVREERDFWKAHSERAESDRQALKADNADLTVRLMRANESMPNLPSVNIPSPPEMAPAAPGQELDFTREFCPSAALQDESMLADRNCGFCDKSSGGAMCPCDVAAADAAAASAAKKRKRSE